MSACEIMIEAQREALSKNPIRKVVQLLEGMAKKVPVSTGTRTQWKRGRERERDGERERERGRER